MALGSVFYAFDPFGNATHRVASSGTIVSTQMFDAYGARASSNNSADPYSGFGGRSGQSYDAETGLHYGGGQYYDAGAGRSLQRGGGAGPGGSLYSAFGNNPVSGGGSATIYNGNLPDPFDDRPCA